MIKAKEEDISKAIKEAEGETAAVLSKQEEEKVLFE
jgi:hypothetical protein